ncbi:MAG: DNA translocase FtsK [Oscillospiraceae bacterium]|nr:DNA translocase FtsK [Oscillospiraceae bacterium]
MPVSSKKKTAGRKAGTGKSKTADRKTSRNTKSNGKKNQKTQDSFLGREILTLASLGISILLLLSCFGVGGYVGTFVGDVLFGLFGTAAYLFPFLLFIGTAFYASNKGNVIAVLKLAAACVALFLICSLIQLLGADQTEAAMVGFYAYGAQRHVSGGLIGGFLVSVMYPALGMAGELIVTIILLIICAVIITEHSFVGEVQKGGRRMADKAREDAVRRKERSRIRQEEREQEHALRMDRKVTGVAFDTKLEPEGQKNDVHEVKHAAKNSQKEMEAAVREPLPGKKQELSGQNTEDPAAPDAEAGTEDASDFPRGKDAFTITGIRMKEEEQQDLSITREIPPFPLDAGSDQALMERKPEDKKRISDETPVSVQDIGAEIDQNLKEAPKEYCFPPLSLLKKGKNRGGTTEAQLRETAAKLQQTLHNFGVNVTITNISCGPAVTRYELQPEQGVKVSKIVSLTDDIKLTLAAADIRIEAPIPGKAAVGIEVPNRENSAVMLRDLLETSQFREHPSRIAFAAGKDIGGQPVVADIAKMPHLLIAGATGSGKSVCINTIIMSILYRAKPDEVKLIMIDPKVVELSVYNGIPHLYIPVVTDPKKAAGALNWAVAEMMKRYELFAECNVRDLKGYNAKVDRPADEDETRPQKLPQIVIIVDELADLMMVAPGEVEDAICRLAQLARAAGIHLVIATQRPSVNVITGLIKANMPSRIAFSVSSGVDSRTILDMNGAEKLLGKGDMLFYPQGYQKPARVQGAFVSDEEVGAVVDFLTKENSVVTYNKDIEEKMNAVTEAGAACAGAAGNGGPERDAYFVEAGKFIIEKDKASIGMLQRWFKIGFNRAARIMDQLAEAGVVGEEEGTKPRKVLMSMEEFEQYVDEYV